MAKVARLSHSKGLRQTEIASHLGVSQVRVSRLLQRAVEAGIIRTVVAIPEGLHAEVEDLLEQRYSLTQVHVVDLLGEAAAEVAADLGVAAVGIVSSLPPVGHTLGISSSSRSVRAMIGEMEASRRRAGTRVVELLGDVGPPRAQHEATRSTQRLADLIGAEALFLRLPGVVMSERMRQAVVAQDGHVREALDALDSVDVALIGVGTCEVAPPLLPGDNFFSPEQLRTREGLRHGGTDRPALHRRRRRRQAGRHRAGRAGHRHEPASAARCRPAHRGRRGPGAGRYEAVRAAVRGGWIDTLVTDLATAERLRDEA